jgi:hypothetical protein
VGADRVPANVAEASVEGEQACDGTNPRGRHVAMVDGRSASNQGFGGRESRRRSRTVGAVGLVVGVVLVAVGLVLLDGAMGRFPLIVVPGQQSAQIDVGTYVITRGPRSDKGPAPTLEVIGPDGYPVPVEDASGNTYGQAKDPIGVFRATAAGTYTVRASDAADESFESVAVERILDGTGEAPTGSFAALIAGALVIVSSFGCFLVGEVRAARLASLPPPPQGES